MKCLERNQNIKKLGKEKDQEKVSTSISPFVIGSIIIVIIWLLSILLMDFLFDNSFNENSAWFGDSFGAINSLFSGLAFAGIIYTILLQRNELQLQRQELRETRQELKRSADAQEKSEAAFTKQIEIMNKTAIINGLSSVADYYSVQMSYTNDPSEKYMHKRHTDDVVARINSLINEMIIENNESEKRTNSDSDNN